MDVTIREADVAPMQIQGPRSKDVIGALFGDAVRDLRDYWRGGRGRRGPGGRVADRLDRPGRLRGLLRDTLRGDDLWEAVWQAGEPFGIRAIAPSEARRIEAGIFNYGSDMRIEDTPFHVSGLEKFVELDQAHDFMGKAALARLAETGVDRKLVGIDIGGDPMTDEGALKTCGRCIVGRGSDRARDRRRLVAEAGAQRGVRVGAGLAHGGRYEARAGRPARHEAATVTALPFVDPNKDPPRGSASRLGAGRYSCAMREYRAGVEDAPSASIASMTLRGTTTTTKTLSPAALTATIDMLAGEFGDADRVLEVGVGTGLLALPLAERGLRVDGIDLSAPMLDRAIEKSHPRTRRSV